MEGKCHICGGPERRAAEIRKGTLGCWMGNVNSDQWIFVCERHLRSSAKKESSDDNNKFTVRQFTNPQSIREVYNEEFGVNSGKAEE